MAEKIIRSGSIPYSVKLGSDTWTVVYDWVINGTSSSGYTMNCTVKINSTRTFNTDITMNFSSLASIEGAGGYASNGSSSLGAPTSASGKLYAGSNSVTITHTYTFKDFRGEFDTLDIAYISIKCVSYPSYIHPSDYYDDFYLSPPTGSYIFNNFPSSTSTYTSKMASNETVASFPYDDSTLVPKLSDDTFSFKWEVANWDLANNLVYFNYEIKSACSKTVSYNNMNITVEAYDENWNFIKSTKIVSNYSASSVPAYGTMKNGTFSFAGYVPSTNASICYLRVYGYSIKYNSDMSYYPFVLSSTFKYTNLPHASTIVTSTTNIGSNPSFAISKKHSDCYSTIEYTFGSLSGTIVSNYTGTVYNSWTIPDEFYYQMPNSKTKTCTITCTTYVNSEYLGVTTSTFTVSVNENVCKPSLSPTAQDSNSTVVALTGDANKFVKFRSNASVNSGATAKYGATIVSQKITCGGKFLSVGSGTINGVESGSFTFTVTDSRGITTTSTINKTLVNYIKPTCNLEAKATVGGTLDFTVTGNYFKGSFGSQSNTLTIKYRTKPVDGSYGSWQTTTATISYDENKYSCDFSISGLDYRTMYVVQTSATDVFETVTSQEIKTRATPVFSWSGSDFEFNVPVYYNDGETQYNICEMIIEMYNAFKNGT